MVNEVIEASEVIRVTLILKFMFFINNVMQFDDLKKIRFWIEFRKISSRKWHLAEQRLLRLHEVKKI